VVQPDLMHIRFGQFEVDEQRFLLQRDAVRLQVRPKVFDLLVHLVRHRERVVLRDELIMALWGTTAVGPGSLSGLVNELRGILGEAGRGPSSIRTVHARGYQFVAEIESREVGPLSPARTDAVARRDGNGGERIATRLDSLAPARELIRASFARVPTVGARAVIVVGSPGSDRSNLLDQASAELVRAGFETHRLLVADRSERHPNALVDRLVDALVEYYGIEAIRSLIPARARELRQRVGRGGRASNARPQDPLASRQYDERVWRSAAELLRELAQQTPLAVILEDSDQTKTAATQAVMPLLRLLEGARVFIVCTGRADEAGESGLEEGSEPGIDLVRLPSISRSRVNGLLESRGVAALHAALAEALMAHVRGDQASLESIAGWLQSERDGGTSASDDSDLPRIHRRMKRVEPDTPSRRPRFGSS